MLPAPLRLAFVGQQTFFRACAWDEDSARATTTFIEFRDGRDPELLRAQLHAFAPDAVVVFRPDVLPRGVLADLPAPVLGFLTEPISRTTEGGAGASHWDLDQRLRETARIDRRNVDRIEADAGLVVNDAAGLGVLDHTMLVHLAAGHLVVAEPPHERRGLRPGIHYLEAPGRDAFRRIVARLHETPDAWDRVRVQGHHASRPFAASRVWPRVLADLLASAA